MVTHPFLPPSYAIREGRSQRWAEPTRNPGRRGEQSRRAARAAAFEWPGVGIGPGAQGLSRLPGAGRQRRDWAEAPRYHEAPVSDGADGVSPAPAAAPSRQDLSPDLAAP